MPLMLREIKVLTDLRGFLCPLGAIDMQVLKDLKSKKACLRLRRSGSGDPELQLRDAWLPCCCANRFFLRVVSLGPSGP